MQSEMDADLIRPVIVYDGMCGMCRKQMRRVRRLDWLHRFDGLEFDQATLRFPHLQDVSIDEGLRVVFPDGSGTVGIDAVRSIAMRTPLGALVGWTLYLPGIHALGQRVYAIIAARRNRDGACKLPHR